VGAPTGVGAAGLNVKSNAPVGVDPLVEIRHADHDVIDASQHARNPPSGVCYTPRARPTTGAIHKIIENCAEWSSENVAAFTTAFTSRHAS
jgi:hypothetical protein